MPKTVSELLDLMAPSDDDLRSFVQLHGGAGAACNILFDAALEAEQLEEQARESRIRRIVGLVDRISSLNRR